MTYYLLLNLGDLGTLGTNYGSEFRFRHGRFIYRISQEQVHCYTSQCTKAWLVRGFICDSDVDDKKAIRILRNNVPVNRIIKHAIAARMHYRMSLEDINNLRAVLMSLK